ncbi:MAG: TIGR04076 family protein [Succinivibrio sp.]|nr:TIGR04076 family protein [Succinivibrio sp.]
MLKVRLTVIKKSFYSELSSRYEQPDVAPCPLEEGMVFISQNAEMPADMCQSAWLNLYPYVLTLAHGGTDLLDGWMRDPHSAIISCNDGVRPVSFLLEALPYASQA